MKLTSKHRDFIDCFDGNVVQSMRVAGFEGSAEYLLRKGEELLKDPTIIKAIKERDSYMESKTSKIMDRQSRQAFWSALAMNEDPYLKPEMDENGIPIPQPANLPLQARLKASEMLARSEADFSENLNLSGNFTLTSLVSQSYDDKLSLEDIEAQYEILKDTRQTHTDPPKTIPDIDPNEFI